MSRDGWEADRRALETGRAPIVSPTAANGAEADAGALPAAPATPKRLLSLIANAGEVCSCDLLAPLARSQPTVSHHTKTLADAGLIIGEKKGRWVWWSIVPERMAELHDALAVGGDRVNVVKRRYDLTTNPSCTPNARQGDRVMTAVGDTAPDFTLKDQNGNDVTLSGLRGKPVVIVFYPFTFTGVCEGELCEIRDNPGVRARRRAGARDLVRHAARAAACGPSSRASRSRCSATSGPTVPSRRPTACSTRRSAAPLAPPSCSTRGAVTATFSSPDLESAPRAGGGGRLALCALALASPKYRGGT